MESWNPPYFLQMFVLSIILLQTQQPKPMPSPLYWIPGPLLYSQHSVTRVHIPLLFFCVPMMNLLVAEVEMDHRIIPKCVFFVITNFTMIPMDP